MTKPSPVNTWIVLVVFTFSIPAFAGDSLKEKLSVAENEYQTCFDSLPAKVKWALSTSSARGRRRWSRALRNRVEVCLTKERATDDLRDTVALSRDLKSMYKSGIDGDRRLMEAEADEIASIIVDTTTVLNGRYKMANVSLWHNFLIWLGTKEGGYCYQWAEELFKALPQGKYTYFERHWGVHNRDKATENNAMIITRRGRPVSDGIVYDPWRGKGRPFWRFVSEDNQKWSQRLTEDDILIHQM